MYNQTDQHGPRNQWEVIVGGKRTQIRQYRIAKPKNRYSMGSLDLREYLGEYHGE